MGERRAMTEIEKARADLLREVMVAHITKTTPTGSSITEMVDTAMRLFDRHVITEKPNA